MRRKSTALPLGSTFQRIIMWPRSLTVSVSLLFSFTFLIYVLFSSTVAPPSLESLPTPSASASASTLPVASTSTWKEKEEEEERKTTPVHETRRANEDRLGGRRVRFLSMSDEENERRGSSSSWWWMDEKEEMIREVLMSSGRGGRKKVDKNEKEEEKEEEEEEEYIAIPRSAFVEMYRRVRAMDTVAKSLRVPDNKKNAFAVDSSIPVSLVGVQPRRLIMARSGQFQYQESSRLERNTIRVMHALYSRFCESTSEYQSDSLSLSVSDISLVFFFFFRPFRFESIDTMSTRLCKRYSHFVWIPPFSSFSSSLSSSSFPLCVLRLL